MSTAKIRETKLLFGVGLSRIKFTGFSPPFHCSALHTRDTVGKVPPIRFRCQHAGQNLACRRGREEGPAGQHLEQDAAEGPHIGSSVGGLSLDLLRRHVCRSADQSMDVNIVGE